MNNKICFDLSLINNIVFTDTEREMLTVIKNSSNIMNMDEIFNELSFSKQRLSYTLKRLYLKVLELEPQLKEFIKLKKRCYIKKEDILKFVEDECINLVVLLIENNREFKKRFNSHGELVLVHKSFANSRRSYNQSAYSKKLSNKINETPLSIKELAIHFDVRESDFRGMLKDIFMKNLYICDDIAFYFAKGKIYKAFNSFLPLCSALTLEEAFYKIFLLYPDRFKVKNISSYPELICRIRERKRNKEGEFSNVCFNRVGGFSIVSPSNIRNNYELELLKLSKNIVKINTQIKGFVDVKYIKFKLCELDEKYETLDLFYLKGILKKDPLFKKTRGHGLLIEPFDSSEISMQFKYIVTEIIGNRSVSLKNIKKSLFNIGRKYEFDDLSRYLSRDGFIKKNGLWININNKNNS